MARATLIESLRSEAARDLAAVRAAARADAERHRADLAAALEQERIRLEQAVAVETRRVEADGAATAQQRTREVRARAAVTLAERLLRLARTELPHMRGGTPQRVFEALARELPPRRWERVRVNPADVAVAARSFPDAAIDVDPAISGGMEVECENGRIRISNTLETRLAIAWPDVLPGLIAELAAGSRPSGTVA